MYYIILKELGENFKLKECEQTLENSEILELLGITEVGGLDVAIMDEFVALANSYSNDMNFKLHIKGNDGFKEKQLNGNVILCESRDGKLGGFEENKAKKLFGQFSF